MSKLRPPTRDAVALGIGVLAIVVGAIRFVRLGAWGLWIDEAFTLADALHGEGFSNPLGYWLFEVFLAGNESRPTELELRLIPAFAGWACIPALWWCLRRALGDRAGAAAALLLASSSWHLYWSQSARFYTLAMLISVIGVGLALRAFPKRSWVQYLVGIGVAGSAAMAHPTASFVLPGLLVAPFVLRWARRDPGRLLRRTALIVAVVGALLGTGWGLKMAGEWLVIKPAGGSPAHLALTTGFYVTPIVGAAALVGAVLGLLRRQPAALVATSVLVVGLFLALVLSLFVRVSAQYVFQFLPWFVALAVVPLARGTEQRRAEEVTARPSDSDDDDEADEADEEDEDEAPARRRPQQPGRGLAAPTGRRALLRRPLVAIGWTAVLVLPSLTNCLLYLGPRQGERPRWKDAYTAVFDRREPGDLVLGMAAPVGEYYLAPGRTDLRDLREVVYLDKYRADVPFFWDRFGRRTWFVLNREELLDWPAEEREAMQRLLVEECRLVLDLPLSVESRDLSVSVFVRD